MTSEELAAFRELVVAELEKHKIAVAHPPVDGSAPRPALIAPPASGGLVAVCLSGQARTLLRPSVQLSMAEKLHHPGYEYFLSTDAPIDPSKLSVRPVVAAYVDRGERLSPDRKGGGNDHGQRTCPAGTMMHPYLFPQVRATRCVPLRASIASSCFPPIASCTCPQVLMKGC